ncbi:MAG: alginate export family protein [Bacteroidetes bacterium]|nr:alginate export family protein [Bacteroidota bacterium]
MRRAVFAVLILGLLSAINLFAQSDVEFSGQIRPRSIMDGLDFKNNSDPATYTELRTRFGAKFTANSDVSGFFQIQDSRIYGTEPNTLASTANLDLHQAYFTWSNIFGLPFSGKFGRMEAVYGSQRLIGPVGWSNVGRSFDGAVFSYKTNKVDFDFIEFNLDENFKAGDTTDLFLTGVYADLKLFDKYKTEVFLLNEAIYQTDNLDRYTIGAYVKGSLGSFSHEVELAYQLGTIIDGGTKQDVGALMATYNAWFALGGTMNTTLSAGVDYLSGDDDAADGKYKVFNTLYATNHKYYGYMDYFTNLPAHTLKLGLMDIHGKVSLQLWESLKAGLNAHLFKANANYTLINGNTSKDFGTEFDFTFGYKANSNVSLEGGFSVFAPGDIFKETRGADTALWSYFMAVVNL